MSDERPRRRFVVDIQVAGDDWGVVAHTLLDLLVHVEEHGPACSSVSGGSSSSHHVLVTEDTEQTHERYCQQLDEYLAARKAAKALEDEVGP